MAEGFHSFSFEHFAMLAVLLAITLVSIRIGNLGGDKTKHWLGFSIALAAFLIMWMDVLYRVIMGKLRIQDDLPLFLCDIAACLLPVFIYTHNRRWMGILYFWAVAGTIQALLTPELKEGFPTFEYFRYFIMHGGIVIAVIYYVVVYRIVINWRDFFNAILYAQIYLVGIHLFNLVVGTNYSYTVAKPESATVLDLMGPWPWYLLFGEGLMVILFLLLMLPYVGKKGRVETGRTS